MDSRTDHLLKKVVELDTECNRLAVRWMEAMGRADELEREIDQADAEIARLKLGTRRAENLIVDVLRRGS